MANEITKNSSLLIDKMQGQFAKVLPKILTPERFCRVVLSSINKNPTLGQALMSPQSQASVISAFMSCAEIGLEPDGRRAAITCFAKKNGGYDVTLIPMFQGLSELAMRSGLISTVHVEKVCENDVFEWNLGRIVNHIPNWKGNRGEPYLYYAHVVFRDGMIKDEVMT
ncbi:MAG: recombinase RecT, partial [Victivallaceae bacterium]